MKRTRTKCDECGHTLGSKRGLEESCELCWHAAMRRDEDLRDTEEQRRVDEYLGK